jgi:hypothetical protein
MGKTITIIGIVLLLGIRVYGQSVQVRVSNAKPQPGEIIYLEYTYPTKPKDMPKTIWSYVASICLDGRYSHNYLYSYVYEVRTFKPGLLKIPSFAVQSEGRQIHSPNIKIPVGNVSQGK